MTLEDFSNQFDVLYDNASNAAPGLDAYEKSVYLTKAQEEIIKSYFNPLTNKTRAGYDGSEERQIDLSSITSQKTYSNTSNPPQLQDIIANYTKFDTHSNTKLVEVKEPILMIVNEFVKVTREGNPINLIVVPINYREYFRLMSKPFKRPLRNQAWRLMNTDNEGTQIVSLNSGTYTNRIIELIVGPKDIITEYTIRYIKKPHPIILDGCDMKIDGMNDSKQCEVDVSLHQDILQRAVELASIPKDTNQKLQFQTSIGNISQTDIGLNTR